MSFLSSQRLMFNRSTAQNKSRISRKRKTGVPREKPSEGFFRLSCNHFILIYSNVLTIIIEEIRHVFRAFIAWWKPRRTFSRIRDAVEGLHLLENSHKLCQGFHQAMKAGITRFISFIKLLFSVLTRRKTIYEALTVNFHNSKTVKPHCSRHFRAS